MRNPETIESIVAWLREDDPEKIESLRGRADELRRDALGGAVHLRGLIEISNYCVRQCAYCGIRAANSKIPRYRMTRDEVLDCVGKADSLKYGSVVLQSGEDDKIDPEWIADVVRTIKAKYPLAVTLSLGECPTEHYRLWKENGADRYLLKFETGDIELYNRIHPPRSGRPSDRVAILRELREIGYQIGGGIMVGLPGQTYASAARDIKLFAELDLDMLSAGPYIPHPDTPLGDEFLLDKNPTGDQIPNSGAVTLKIMALARIFCPQANMPVTTALATKATDGYLEGLRWGANVIMPNITPVKYRRLYEIYPDAINKDVEDVHNGIARIIEKAGRTIAAGPGHRIVKGE